ncbi:MAG TPA: DNRLRE domain-containing protein [bacterium]|nr:DNRLRE domain-containing protein [bacterium]
MKPLLALGLAASLLAAGCTHDKPLPSGFDDLQRPDKGELKTVELRAVDSGRFWTAPVVGLAPTLLFGQFADTRSFLLLQFSGLSEIDTANVRSATVYLHQVSRFGDGDAFSAIVRPVTAEWTESEVAWDKAKNHYDPAVEWGRFEVPAADSGWFSFALDTTAVDGWIRDASKNFGVLLEFNQADYMAVLNSSDSDTSAGYGRFVYTTRAGVLDTVVSTISKDASLLIHQGAVAAETLEPRPDRLWIDDAAGYRSLLRFDLSSLPGNATVHHAVLTLHIDQSASTLPKGGLAITCNAVVNDSLWRPATLAADTLATYPGGYAYSDQSQLVFSGTTATRAMAALVQNWVLRNPPNYGMLLTGPYGADAARISLYTGVDQPEYTPKIEITYSIPPTTKF